MIVGALLVLITWLIAVAACMVLGLAPALRARDGRSLALILRQSLWWGLLVATGAILTINLRVPLQSAVAAWAFAVLVLVMGVAGYALLRRGWGGLRVDLGWRGRWWLAPLCIALAICAGYLAFSALGPVTNYDTGLYHLGAIKYAGEFPTIRGLANVYAPFGYNNSLFPIAAFLGNGPWDAIGYRLVNGLIMMLMGTDLVIRLLQRKYSVGTFLLLTGLLASWLPLIAISDYWVTSPTSDTAVMLLTLVSAAYLADGLTNSRVWQSNAAVSLAIGLLLVSMRPLMAFYLVAVMGVLILFYVYLRNQGMSGRKPRILVWVLVAIAGVLLGVVQTARDYLLSGWLQFPLSVWAFDVPWRATDPSSLVSDTLGSARDAANFHEAAMGWAWVPGWFLRLPSQWEFYELSLLMCGALVTLVVAHRIGCPLRGRLLMLAMAPAFLTAVVWFLLAPPTFRMAWGPIFSLAIIPLGWALYALHRRTESSQWIANPIGFDAVALMSVSATLVVLLAYCGLTRLDPGSMTESRTMSLGPVHLEYVISPVPFQEVDPIGLATGVRLLFPRGSDQCWDAYPLCTPWPEMTMTRLGPQIADGYFLGQ